MSLVPPLLVSALALLASSGCGIERSGLGVVDGRAERDGGSDIDGAERMDGAVDGSADAPFDAGPFPDAGCLDHEAPSALWSLGAADFAATGAEHLQTAVDRPGVLTLETQPYRYGGLLFRGYDDVLISDPPEVSAVAGATPTGLAVSGDLDETWGVGSSVR